MSARAAGIKFGFKFDGGTELVAELRKLAAKISRRVQLDALTSAAEPMRARMEQLAPRGDNPSPVHLSESMVVSPSPGVDGYEIAVAIGPSKAAFYGGLQEFGTANNSAHAFARPAFDAEHMLALEVIAEQIWVELAGQGVRPGMSTSAPAAPSSPGGGGLL